MKHLVGILSFVFVFAFLLSASQAEVRDGASPETCTTSGGLLPITGPREIFCIGQCPDNDSGDEVKCQQTAAALIGPGFDYYDCTCGGDEESTSSNPCCHIVISKDSGQFATIGSCPSCGATGTCSVLGGSVVGTRAEARCS